MYMALIKTTKEIENIAKACEITDQIFKDAIVYVKKNRACTEIELQKYILQLIKNKKLRPSFPPIVTSGARAGNDIHPKPTEKKLVGFTIIDLGVRYEGYCSDMTRTIYIGTPTEKEKEIYQKILDVQLLGITLSVVGAYCSDIDASVRTALDPLKKYFIHTLGHGVGRKIHEAPIIYEKRTKPVLKEGMVITIEPGIYIKNKLGIRIEDTIVVQGKKPTILTKTSKKLLSI
jgi:Xaa-Pro aminopeptidase